MELFRNFALYEWHSRVSVSSTSTVVKIIIQNLQQSKNLGRAYVLKGHRTLIKFYIVLE